MLKNVNIDELKGTAKQLSGKMKHATGALVGDQGLMSAGRRDEMAGKMRHMFGATSHKASDLASEARRAVDGLAKKSRHH